MRVLLRSKVSRHYFQDRGQWTSDRGAARDFGTSGRAILFAMENQLSGLEVVLTFDNPQYDVAIPLHDGLPHTRLERRER
jgi:hypothetical protein